MISVTPISGMTLTTLILSAIILAKLGLSGPDGMLATLLIGGVVCTALSMTGTLVTEFKISYWLGATPRRVQWSNILAAAMASITVTGAIMLFASTKGYLPSAAHPNPMPAPQANAMAAVIQSVMASAEAPWLLYGVGAVIALIVEMLACQPWPSPSACTCRSSSTLRSCSERWSRRGCGGGRRRRRLAAPATTAAP